MTVKSPIVHNTDINKAAIQQLYASKLQASFEKFARAITHTKTAVNVVKSGPGYNAPAWSDDKGLTVVHDLSLGSIIAADNIVRLKGLLIHELSHLVFTPRNKTHFVKDVLKFNLTNEFNILEDNRIENLMLAKLSGVKPWLVHTVANELQKDLKPEELLPLVWGRKYLPKKLRKQALKDWDKNKSVPNHGQLIAKVIDEYLRLTLSSKEEQVEAMRLLRQFRDLITPPSDPSNPQRKPWSFNHPGYNCSPESDGSQPATKGQQDKLLKQSPLTDDELDTDDDDLESDEQANGEGEYSIGSSPVQEMLEEAFNDARSEILEDVKSTIQSIRESDEVGSTPSEADDESKSTLKVFKSRLKSTMPPKPQAVTAARKFASTLTELRALHDPGWVRKTNQGRINLHQFMLGADFEELFDEWSSGNQDVTDIECVILLDNSGSMADRIEDAYNAMWSIKRGLDSINASTTVVQFGTHGVILYPANSKAGAQIATARYEGGGNTMPFHSLRYAKQILDNSSRAIKILLVITDGAWSNAMSCEQVIMGMRMSGVLTGLVFLEDKAWAWLNTDSEGNLKIDGHKCEIVTALKDPMDIVDVAKSLTALAQKKVLSY